MAAMTPEEERTLRAFERLAARNHELNGENAGLRRMLALALETLWRPEPICILGDRVARMGWIDDHKN